MASTSRVAKKAGRKGAAAAGSVVRTLSDPRKTKRLMAIGKVVAPLLTPVAIKAVDGLRYAVDQQRAKRLGVRVADVAEYRGPTGRIRARMDALAEAVADLRRRRTGDSEVAAFADRANAKIADLAAATAAAAPMPAARRRPTLAAVARELDQLEGELIRHLVRTGV